MKAVDSERKDKNLKVWVKFAEELFKKCFDKAGFAFEGPQTKGYPAALERALKQFMQTAAEDFELPDSKFIRNKVSEIFKAKAAGNKAISFRSGTIAIFLKYAHYEQELELLKFWTEPYFPADEYSHIVTTPPAEVVHPQTLDVLYTPKAFRTFSFMRTINAGKLNQTGNGWEYCDAEQRFFGTIEKVELFVMPGESSPFWLKVTFVNNQEQHTAYFAQGHSIPQHSLTEESPLYQFLFKFLS